MPATVAFSNQSPTTGATGVDLSGDVTVDVALLSSLNPIDTVTATYNGYAVAVARESLGGTDERLSLRGPVRARLSNTAVFTVTTQDTEVNTETITYTARLPFPGVTAEADMFASSGRRTEVAGDMGVLTAAWVGALGDMSVRPVGNESRTDAIADMAVLAQGGGPLDATPGLGDFAATEYEQAALLAISARVSEFHESREPITALVEGTERRSLDMTVLVSGTLTDRIVPASVVVSAWSRFPLLALSALIAQHKDTRLPADVLTEEMRARVLVELFVASQALQGVEDE